MSNNSQKKIFIVEDEEDIITLMKFNLEKEGYKVDFTTSGKNAVEKINQIQPHLVILDIMIPGLDGYEICKDMKKNENTNNIPIIMVSAKDQEHNIITGLELGANDYMTKPFSINILIARIRAILRKPTADKKEVKILEFGPLSINPKEHTARLNSQNIKLSLTEFKILSCLANSPNWTFTRNQLIDASKGEDYFVTDRVVDVAIVSLRKKLKDNAHFIETVRGVGYKFNPTP